MRVVVEIVRTDEQTWTVSVRWAGRTPPGRLLTRMAHRPWIASTAPPDDLAELHADHCELAGRQLEAVEKGRPLTGDEPERLGRFLFAALLAPEWDDVLTDAPAGDPIEVALTCPVDAHGLHALPWELMHDGNTFLALRPDRSVAVTRVVAGEHTTAPRTIAAPPRVLFAIGSELTDPQVRAGAEFLGLLRALEHDGDGTLPGNGSGGITARVLDRASAARLEATVREFGPDVVHLIGHGSVSGPNGEGVLTLRSDDPDNRGGVDVGADVLLDALRVAPEGIPPLVVLSACQGAAVGGAHAASLAARLVEGGVPIVVAMSGRVADRACRLFTRRFGRVLVAGGPLVEALVDARRAAYLEAPPPPGTVDWALPALFVSTHVAADHVPVAPATGMSVRELIRGLGLGGEPVFCGRRPFFDAYEQLVDPEHRLNALVIHTDGRSEGVGKRRLLTELAAQALRDGHVPVLLKRVEDQAPKTVRGLAVELLKTIEETRSGLHLPPGTNGVLLTTLGVTVAWSDDPDVRESQLAAALQAVAAAPGPLDAAVIRPALAADLRRLAEAARAAATADEPTLPPAFARARPLLLLGSEVERWDEAREALFGPLLTANGLGKPGEPVPVVISAALNDVASEVMEQQRERSTGETWLRFMELGPFADGEATLAYEWVLLNPRPGLWPVWSSDKVHAVREQEGPWCQRFRDAIGGIPGNLNGQMFYLCAAWSVDQDEFVRDDDDQALKSYQERLGR